MEIRPDEITTIIKKQIESFEATVELQEVGQVVQVGDGIARVYGLEKVMAGELVEFSDGLLGMALNLEEDNVGCVLFGDDVHIKEGDSAKRTGRIMEIPVGDAMLGRVINPLGQPIDGKLLPGISVPKNGRVVPSDAPGFGLEIPDEWIVPWDHAGQKRGVYAGPEQPT